MDMDRVLIRAVSFHRACDRRLSGNQAGRRDGCCTSKLWWSWPEDQSIRWDLVALKGCGRLEEDESLCERTQLRREPRKVNRSCETVEVGTEEPIRLNSSSVELAVSSCASLPGSAVSAEPSSGQRSMSTAHLPTCMA